jgi:hypothetical protein
MATVKVSGNYSSAKSGKPPVGDFKPRQEMSRNPTVKRNFPGGMTGSQASFKNASSATYSKPAQKHHVASRAVKAGLKSTPATRAASTGARRGTSARKLLPRANQKTESFIGKAADKSPVLLAEFVAGLAIIGIAMFTRSATEKYNDVITGVIARYTAFTAVFFVLFLMASGKRSSQAAAWFGLLIDLGLVFDAVNHNMFQDLSSFIKGTGLPPKTTLVSASKPEEFFETSDIKGTTVQAGAVQSPSSPSGGSSFTRPI